jgi:hypothetical protein
MALNGGMSDQLIAKQVEEAVVAYFKALYRRSPGG